MGEQDNIFATEAIRRGFVTMSTLDEAKALQKKFAELGVQESLAEVMVKRNYLTREQADSIAAAGKGGGKFTIPGYKITAKIGSGGMGTVYRATQLSIDRSVAIKILSSKVNQDMQSAERFTREARNLARLNHVNIVTAIDAGKIGNVLYYVMEYVEGESLGDVLKRRGKLPEQEALHIAIQVTRALDHANGHGIIHRDIKPDNILMTRDGIAKVTDLGLAKSQGEDASLTQTGIAVGTPNYISPEQARGERDLDTRSDIYSLGATLYHMVAGTTPFKGSSAMEVVTKHLTEQMPSPKQSNQLLSDGICAIVGKMMEKTRERRYQDQKQLLGDLELAMDGKMPRLAKLLPVRQTSVRPGTAVKASRPGAGSMTRATRRAALPMEQPKKSPLLPIALAAGGAVLLGIIVAVAMSGGGAPVARRGGTEKRTEQAPPPVAVKPVERPTPPREPIVEKRTPEPERHPIPENPPPPPQEKEPWKREAEEIRRATETLAANGQYASARTTLTKGTDYLRGKYPEMGLEWEKPLTEKIDQAADRDLKGMQTLVLGDVAGGDDEKLDVRLGELKEYKKRQLPRFDTEIEGMIRQIENRVAAIRKEREDRERLSAGARKEFETLWREKIVPPLAKWDYKTPVKILETEQTRKEIEPVREEIATAISDLKKVDALFTELWGLKRASAGGATMVLSGADDKRTATIGAKKFNVRRDEEKMAEVLPTVIRAKYEGFPEKAPEEVKTALALFCAYDGDGATAMEIAGSDNKALARRVEEIAQKGLALPPSKCGDLFAVVREPGAVAEAPVKAKSIDFVSRGSFARSSDAKALRQQIEEDAVELEKYLDIVRSHKFGELKGTKKIFQYADDHIAVVARGSGMEQIAPQRLFIGSADAKDSFVSMRGRILSTDGFEIWLRANEKTESGIALRITPIVEIDPGRGGVEEILKKALQGEAECKFTIEILLMEGGEAVDTIGEESMDFGLFRIHDFHTIDVGIKRNEITLDLDDKSLLKRYRLKGENLPERGKMGVKIPVYPAQVVSGMIKLGTIGELLNTFGLHIRDLSYKIN